MFEPKVSLSATLNLKVTQRKRYPDERYLGSISGSPKRNDYGRPTFGYFSWQPIKVTRQRQKPLKKTQTPVFLVNIKD
jgi:hypothetical protein